MSLDSKGLRERLCHTRSLLRLGGGRHILQRTHRCVALSDARSAFSERTSSRVRRRTSANRRTAQRHSAATASSDSVAAVASVDDASPPLGLDAANAATPKTLRHVDSSNGASLRGSERKAVATSSFRSSTPSAATESPWTARRTPRAPRSRSRNGCETRNARSGRTYDARAPNPGGGPNEAAPEHAASPNITAAPHDLAA